MTQVHRALARTKFKGGGSPAQGWSTINIDHTWMMSLAYVLLIQRLIFCEIYITCMSLLSQCSSLILPTFTNSTQKINMHLFFRFAQCAFLEATMQVHLNPVHDSESLFTISCRNRESNSSRVQIDHRRKEVPGENVNGEVPLQCLAVALPPAMPSGF